MEFYIHISALTEIWSLLQTKLGVKRNVFAITYLKNGGFSTQMCFNPRLIVTKNYMQLKVLPNSHFPIYNTFFQIDEV